MCMFSRLMHHAHNITASLPPYTEEFTDEGLPDTAREAVQVLRSMYQVPYFFGYKTEFFPSKTIPKI